ncbi:OmpA family protein [Motiliproteus sediminis]|uniref:OmpA family protein n=1 Tax=Motiliproteus sediminis TaxID=1468178 RepID=UPI001AF017B2|nr:OmpA family protein [Motiliproteus sediminis]
MNTVIAFNKNLIAAALATSLTATPLLAAEVDKTPQHIGAGTGAVAGAVVAGPIGAILGTAFGTLVGHKQVQENTLEAQQKEHDRLSQQLRDTYSQLAAAEQQLSDRRAQLAAVEQQMTTLDDEHRALKAMVSGLKLSVYFAQNSSQVDPRYEDLLKSLSDGADKVKGLTIDLAGHSNTSGPDHYNQALSERRGKEVGETLQQHGLPPFRIITQGKGVAEVSSNNPYSPLDRRVDLQFRFDPRDEALVSER